MCHQLYCTLHIDGPEQATIDVVPEGEKPAGPQFILFRVETLMVDIRKDLDMPYTPSSSEEPPLMMRIREHLDCISSVLTGLPIKFQDPDTTTLAELIHSVSYLNRSVCTPAETVWCTIT